ncbi:DUF4824 family protein [Wenzhouxiangella sp. EGI_FJ10409]|uniref:DUF4824 family protein n=1 Tax=Wenzhouxiangella sp. EGI_FJ10409 TaxID=3243767 RepID=UPI0035DCB79A
MRIRLSVFAIVLVALVNAWLLAGVAWNRSGEPEAVLALTERELALPSGRWARRENSGVALSIRRVGRDADWLDRDKLAALGFDVDGREARAADRRRPLARRAFVALEFDGPAFDALVAAQQDELETLRVGLDSDEANRRQVERARASLERLERVESRLVAIDAARDAEALRERYPDRDRYAVMPARLRMYTVSRPGGEQAEVRGRIESLLPRRVHVPRRFQAPLQQATQEHRAPHDAPPRFRVRLAFGRSGAPWVTGIEPMGEAAASSGGS